jgi:hypothetical protein
MQQTGCDTFKNPTGKKVRKIALTFLLVRFSVGINYSFFLIRVILASSLP